MPAGGRQPNAGHPTRHEQESEQVAAAKTRAAAWKIPVINLKRNLETAQELASGVYYEKEVEMKDGSGKKTVRIYRERPHWEALKLLIEQGGGKATQRQQVETETRINIRPAFDWGDHLRGPGAPEPGAEDEEETDE